MPSGSTLAALEKTKPEASLSGERSGSRADSTTSGPALPLIINCVIKVCTSTGMCVCVAFGGEGWRSAARPPPADSALLCEVASQSDVFNDRCLII